MQGIRHNINAHSHDITTVTPPRSAQQRVTPASISSLTQQASFSLPGYATASILRHDWRIRAAATSQAESSSAPAISAPESQPLIEANMARAEGGVMALRERTAQNEQTGAIREATFSSVPVYPIVADDENKSERPRRRPGI